MNKLLEIINVTLNPSDSGSSISLTNNNLTARNATTNTSSVRATHGRSVGKWYWEVIIGGSSSYLTTVGVSNKIFSVLNSSIRDVNQRSYYYNGNRLPEHTSYGLNITTGDIIGVALDLDNGTLEFYKNGVSKGISHTNIEELGEVYPTIYFGSYSTTGSAYSREHTYNFGASPFVYSIPHGFYSYDGRHSSWYNRILISSEDMYYSVIPELHETSIPQMISNTNPNGRAFASSERSDNYASRAFDRSENPYSSANNSGGIGHLGYEFINPTAIGKYSIRSVRNYSYIPRDWTFEGSNDGTNWDVLDTQVNQAWTITNTYKEYVIDIFNVHKYNMYRLNWTANNGGAYSSINELKMYALGTLIKVPNQSKQAFINHGINKDTSIDLTTSKIIEQRYIVQDSTQLGLGKVLRQKIDATKIPIRNAVIE